MGKISGVSTTIIDNVDGFFTSGGGGGGTASTTPTITYTQGPFGTGSVEVTNHSSFTNPNYECVVTVGGSTIIGDSDVDHSLDTGSDSVSANMSFVDADASTGTRTVTVKAQEFGDFIQSAGATTTYDPNPVQNRYIRFYGCNSAGTITNSNVFIQNIAMFTGAGLTGTEYPTTALTDYTSETGIAISAGDEYNSTYAGWKAFDGSSSTGWWSLGVPNASVNWLQIEFEPATYTPAPTLKSCRFRFSGSNTATHLKILGSDTGTFTGEETDYGFFEIVEGVNQDLG